MTEEENSPTISIRFSLHPLFHVCCALKTIQILNSTRDHCSTVFVTVQQALKKIEKFRAPSSDRVF